jgi:hypothetical protein
MILALEIAGGLAVLLAVSLYHLDTLFRILEGELVSSVSRRSP